VLHHPVSADTSPCMLLERYSDLLKKLDRASKELPA